MALGSYLEVSLAAARDAAKTVKSGGFDPVQESRVVSARPLPIWARGSSWWRARGTQNGRRAGAATTKSVKAA